MVSEIDALLELDPLTRQQIISNLSPAERVALDQQLEYRLKNPWLKYQGDPVSFVQTGLGETLWSKQKQILESVRDNKRTVVPACHAPGKVACVTLPVFTPDGWRKWGDIQIGDPLFGEDGQVVHVTARTPVHTRPYYRVTFDDGTTFDAGDNHRWVVHDAKTRHKLRQRERHHGRTITDWRDWWDEGTEITTKEMAAKVTVPNGKKAVVSNWSVPTVRPLKGVHRPLPIPPYTLGVWLGDGTTNGRNVALNNEDSPHMLSRIHAEGVDTGAEYKQPGCVRVGIPGLPLPLGHKHIPREYFMASIEQREALLHGLMDSDGWAGKGTNVACLGFSNPELFEDALELVRGLGYAPQVTSKIPKIGEQEYGEHWMMSWHYDRPVFTLPRYGAPERSPQAVRGTARYITSIEPIGEQEGMCVEVDSQRRLYVAGRQHIVTHNSHIAARVIAYWVSVYPQGTAKVITTATSGKQAKTVMWPHVRRLVSKHGLPGETNSETWFLGDQRDREPTAMVLKPPDDDEAGVQGHHAPNMLIVVDEGGGIHPTFGKSLEALMTGANTRLLVLGNPPTEEEDTWFEQICSSPLYNKIQIGAFDTPNFTGEYSGVCKTCPPEQGEHEVAVHLINTEWVEDVRQSFGEDSPYWVTRVEANFARDNTAKAVPISWLEAGKANTLETYEGRIKLGVDIASDGGDEFAIAKLDGWKLGIDYVNRGGANEDAVQVAGKVLEHIREAERVHAERGIDDRVRVKLDAAGLGWGVVSMLENWGREGKHRADIVGVNVAERARDSEKFLNQRAEMWWNMRDMLQPHPDRELELWLDVDTMELSQLNGPMYKTSSNGRIQIEKKADMKRRGLRSPDRAEALLLAVYEPPNAPPPIVAPVLLGQVNQWQPN